MEGLDCLEAWVNFGHGIKAIWRVLICHALGLKKVYKDKSWVFVWCGVACEDNKKCYTTYITYFTPKKNVNIYLQFVIYKMWTLCPQLGGV
jgi:hypothetical protein